MHFRYRRAIRLAAARRARIAASLAMLIVGAVALSAHAQQPIAPAEWKRGYHGLAMLCRAAELQLSPSLGLWRRVPPDRSMLIILGDTRYPPVDLRQYLNRGGAVLIASDRSDHGTLRRYGLTIQEGPLRAARAADCLDGFPDCPIVTRLSDDHSITRSIRVIATNRPGALELSGWWETLQRGTWRWRPVAWLPTLEGSTEEGPPLIAVRQAGAAGRGVVLADPSVLSNQMLLRGDNALLAGRILRWLGEPTRTNVLIWEDSRIALPASPSQVDVQLPMPTPEELAELMRHMPPETLLEIGNAVVRSVEDQRLIDQAVHLLFQRMGPVDIRRLLITAATSVLCLVGLTALVNSVRVHQPDHEVRTARAIGRRDTLCWERWQAAGGLWHAWQTELTRGEPADSEPCIQQVGCPGRPLRSWYVRRQLVRWQRRITHPPAGYWTTFRLRRWERQIRDWRKLHQQGILVYRPHGERGKR